MVSLDSTSCTQEGELSVQTLRSQHPTGGGKEPSRVGESSSAPPPPHHKVTGQEEELKISLTSVFSLLPATTCMDIPSAPHPLYLQNASRTTSRHPRHSAWYLRGAQYVFVECMHESVAQFSRNGVSKHRFLLNLVVWSVNSFLLWGWEGGRKPRAPPPTPPRLLPRGIWHRREVGQGVEPSWEGRRRRWRWGGRRAGKLLTRSASLK